MNRQIIVCGVEMAVQSTYSESMDSAFDRLYAEFTQTGRLAIDHKFISDASHYFDGYIGSGDAPAAHDHYFYGFAPIWHILLHSHRPLLAEKVWEQSFEPVKQWEAVNPGQLIDKGLLCYYWGATALLNGNLDRGYLLIHQSVEEDSRTSQSQVPPTPSYALVSLNYEKPNQAFQEWVLTQASFLESFVSNYVATHHRALTVDDVKHRFLENPPSYDTIFLLTFTLARLHGISGLPDKAKRNDFAGQIQLNVLFDLLLVIEVAIRNVNPTTKAKTYFLDQASFLLDSANHPLLQKDFDEVHTRFKTDFQAAIREALDGTLKTSSVLLDRFQCDVHLAYELRNHGAHQIETVPIIWQEFDRVQQVIFRCLCAAIDFLY